ncbi:MAG: methyltransferase domain-containing protein [Parcubacteria group bacterium]|nr:methyltransferase domain-containing protein [Parcubacteria group bacterium]
MAYLLFPGRHLLNTQFQETYLWDTLRLPIAKLDLLGESPLDESDRITHVLFVITSANQENSRYNPVPFHIRAIGVDRFARPYAETLGVDYRIFGMPHFPPTERFAGYTLKEVSEHTEHELTLTPKNTIILCSTEPVINQYRALGFSILPAEFDPNKGIYRTETPIDIVKKFVASGESWETDEEILRKLSKATIDLWHAFPEVPRKIFRLWRDPLLTEAGSLTETRNYVTYVASMGRSACIETKYGDIKQAILPGKIVDEGCADGALISLLAWDFPDSDLVGIEVTSEFVARCKERQRAGDFGGTFVYVHQRNIMERMFEDASIDTTICNSTTHELWSYGDRQATLDDYLAKKYLQTRWGGRLVIRDVIGPEKKDEEIFLWANDADGANDNVFKDSATPEELRTHLESLSTYARFLRFARDFLADMRSNGKRGPETRVRYREESLGGKRYIVLRLRDAVEFMMKKDYIDNWQSELNEEFAFWSFREWKEALARAGFTVIENPNTPMASSRTYVNPWIVENRYREKVALFKKRGERLWRLPYPVTNVVLIGEKRPQREYGDRT